MASNSKRVTRAFTNEEKNLAMNLFNTFDGGRFCKLVVEAGNDKNSEKGAAWDKFTLAFQKVKKPRKCTSS